MYREFYADNPFVSYALAAFVFFFLLFVSVLLKLMASKNGSNDYESAVQLPLEDDHHG